jgi:protein-disulfide isomerase
MMWNQNGDHARFKDIVDAIFATPDRAEAEAIIEHYDRYWMDIVGTRGFKGKKTKNARAQFNALFDIEEPDDGVAGDEVEFDESKLDELAT